MLPSTLATQRLRLVGVTPEHIDAFRRGRHQLSELLGAKVPDSFPVPESSDSLSRWASFLLVYDGDGMVIGDAGFKSRPDPTGHVNLVFGIVPEYRRRGFATEASRAVVESSLSHPDIRSVGAHTAKDGIESIGVLRKIGFWYLRDIDDPDDGEWVEWRVSR